MITSRLRILSLVVSALLLAFGAGCGDSSKKGVNVDKDMPKPATKEK